MRFKMAILGLTLTAALTAAAMGMLKLVEEELKKNVRTA